MTVVGIDVLAKRLGPEKIAQLEAEGHWPPTIGIFIEPVEPDPAVIASLGERLALSFETPDNYYPEVATDIRKIFSF